MNIKKKLEKEVWRSETYYQIAKQGSLDLNHPGMKILKKLSSKANSILDLGCGEGTRLNEICSYQKAVGIDISKTAINWAKKAYPHIKFIKGDLEKIPLKDKSFDLVYSAYVLEHLTNPKMVINEAIRLLKPGSFLVLIAPNYGAPNRASPPFKKSRVLKFINGLFKDFRNLFYKQNNLEWTFVVPIASKEKYNIDWDTTVEPYVGNLLLYLKLKGLKIAEYTTCWSEELENAKFHQIIIRLMGELGVYPFNMWGPHFVIVAQKNES